MNTNPAAERLAAAIRTGEAGAVAVALMRHPVDTNTVHRHLGEIAVRSIDAARPVPAAAVAVRDLAARSVAALQLAAIYRHDVRSWWAHVAVSLDGTMAATCTLNAEDGDSRACLLVLYEGELWFWLGGGGYLDVDDELIAGAANRITTTGLAHLIATGGAESEQGGGGQVVEIRHP